MTDGKNEDDTGGLDLGGLKGKLTQVNADASARCRW